MYRVVDCYQAVMKQLKGRDHLPSGAKSILKRRNKQFKSVLKGLSEMEKQSNGVAVTKRSLAAQQWEKNFQSMQDTLKEV